MAKSSPVNSAVSTCGPSSSTITSRPSSASPAAATAPPAPDPTTTTSQARSPDPRSCPDRIPDAISGWGRTRRDDQLLVAADVLAPSTGPTGSDLCGPGIRVVAQALLDLRKVEERHDHEVSQGPPNLIGCQTGRDVEAAEH